MMFLKLIIICAMIYLVHSEACDDNLRRMADDQMHFVRCVSVHSVPITMCITCKQFYDDLLHSYDLLVANCFNIYFDKDRINLVASTEFALTSLWSKAFCDDCFNNNNSDVFNEKNDTFYECLDKHPEERCKNCKDQYLDLNNFCINLDQHNNGEVCYDLQDSMNRTRNKWSKELHCCRRDQNLMLFMVVLGITSCLPLLFYGTTFYITKRQERSQRILFDEAPYNSDVPTSSPRQNYTNDINNPTQSMLDNIQSSSNADQISPVAGTSLPTNEKKSIFLNDDTESSDDDMGVFKNIKPQEKIKNI